MSDLPNLYINDPVARLRGFAYADGFFSTMAVVAGQIQWLAAHERRLSWHADALQLSVPVAALSRHLCQTALDMGEGILKVMVSRLGQPVSGYGYVDGEARMDVLTLPMPLPAYHAPAVPFAACPQLRLPVQQAGQAVCLRQQIACLPSNLVGLKSLNRLGSVMAAGELTRAKACNPLLVEGLVQDVSGQWVEGVVSNVFYQLAGSATWFTPPIDRSGVAGVMREVILQSLVRQTGQSSGSTPQRHERRLTDADLPKLTGLFFCNAVRGVMPIERLYHTGGEVIL